MAGTSKKPISKWQRFRKKDAFVRDASRIGVRSRSYFKLEELDRQFGLLKPGMAVLDLGASPGGWSQYASSVVGAGGAVFAADVIAMKPLANVEFIECDLTAGDAAERIGALLGPNKAQLMLSDMAPNITGNSAIDARNYFDIYASIFKICHVALADNGSLAFKFFQTDETSILKQSCERIFNTCRIFKPKSSRAKSRESYLVAKGYRPQPDALILPDHR